MKVRRITTGHRHQGVRKITPAKRYVYALWAIPFLVFAAIAYGVDDTSSGPLVPDGLIIEDAFKPGIGSPVGKVASVLGEVLIVHEDTLKGYRSQKGLPLFQGDTIIALEKGRTKLELNDGSALTLIPETKLTISESIYDPEEKGRSSYIDVSVGKVRFVVTKLTDYRRSVFEVETPTAATGLRGSDFVTLAMADVSEITAFEDTTLGVRSKDFLEEPPLLIRDFEKAIVERGKRPHKVKVSRDEAEQLKKEFQLPGEGTSELQSKGKVFSDATGELKKRLQSPVEGTSELQIKGKALSDATGELKRGLQLPGEGTSELQVTEKVFSDATEELKKEFQLPDEETLKLAGVSRSYIEGIWLLKNKGREWVNVAFRREGGNLVGEVVKKHRSPGSSRSWMGFTIDGIECVGDKIIVSCVFEHSKGKLPPRNMILHLTNDASRLEGFFEDTPNTRITGERKHEH